MIVRIQPQPFTYPAQRALRWQGLGLIALGVGVLAVWNPLARPGPTVCMLRNAFGLPCPLCGMTRGVALSLRGQPADATLLNPLTVPVLVTAVLLALLWAIELAAGRRFVVVMPRRLSRLMITLGWTLFAANWVYLLIYRREDPFATTWFGQVWTLLSGG
jgi:hypothetical protein